MANWIGFIYLGSVFLLPCLMYHSCITLFSLLMPTFFRHITSQMSVASWCLTFAEALERGWVIDHHVPELSFLMHRWTRHHRQKKYAGGCARITQQSPQTAAVELLNQSSKTTTSWKVAKSDSVFALQMTNHAFMTFSLDFLEAAMFRLLLRRPWVRENAIFEWYMCIAVVLGLG